MTVSKSRPGRNPSTVIVLCRVNTPTRNSDLNGSTRNRYARFRLWFSQLTISPRSYVFAIFWECLIYGTGSMECASPLCFLQNFGNVSFTAPDPWNVPRPYVFCKISGMLHLRHRIHGMFKCNCGKLSGIGIFTAPDPSP